MQALAEMPTQPAASGGPLACKLAARVSHRLSPDAQVLAESHADLHPLVDELLAALNVTGARRVHPAAGRARTLADLARGHRAAGVAADRLVLPCRTPPSHPQLWRRARPCFAIRSRVGSGSSYCMPHL